MLRIWKGMLGNVGRCVFLCGNGSSECCIYWDGGKDWRVVWMGGGKDGI